MAVDSFQVEASVQQIAIACRVVWLEAGAQDSPNIPKCNLARTRGQSGPSSTASRESVCANRERERTGRQLVVRLISTMIRGSLFCDVALFLLSLNKDQIGRAHV